MAIILIDPRTILRFLIILIDPHQILSLSDP